MEGGNLIFHDAAAEMLEGEGDYEPLKGVRLQY
jgi:hypothetical protein